MSPAQTKIEAMKEAKPPTNVSDLRSYLDMCNYSARFTNNYSSRTHKLRELLLKGKPWEWTLDHQKEFNDINSSLTAHTQMAYYHKDRETEVHVDASPFGVGAMLGQADEAGNFRQVTYSSRSLTPTQQKYAHIEREAVAVLYACTQFEGYLLGTKFIALSDYEPLQTLYNNPKSQISARIERMRLRLLKYDFVVKYRPGRKCVVDYLSRHPLADHENELEADQFICLISSIIPDAIILQKIKSETDIDNVLSKLVRVLQGDYICLDKDQELKVFKPILSELTLVDGIILRGERIVIPEKLQEVVVKLAHEGHLGIVRTKQYLRDRSWFSGIDKMTEHFVKQYPACPTAEPAKMSELPDGPWRCLSMDFCGPFPSGDYLFAIMDDYSRFPVVEVIRSAETVIPKLDQILAEYSTPREIRRDNGPPFNSSVFLDYANSFGVPPSQN